MRSTDRQKQINFIYHLFFFLAPEIPAPAPEIPAPAPEVNANAELGLC